MCEAKVVSLLLQSDTKLAAATIRPLISSRAAATAEAPDSNFAGMSATARIACSYAHVPPPDAQHSLAGGTPLHAAAFAGNLGTVSELLVKNRSDLLEACTAEGSTAVHLAARRGHVAVVRALIGAGCNTSAQAAGRALLINHAVMSDNLDLFTATVEAEALGTGHLRVRARRLRLRAICLMASS